MQAEVAIGDGTVAMVMSLFADYARLLDFGRDPRSWAGLYRADGVLVVGTREIRGTDALAEFAAASIPGVHVQAVPHLRAGSDGGLDATSSFVFITSATADMRAGYYTDQLALQDGRFVFVRREITILARTDAA
jgi:hypothetical protein